MTRRIKIPRILKVSKTEGLKAWCIFNNGEERLINFERLFNTWQVNEASPEYKLLDKKEFAKVKVENGTLTWHNVLVSLLTENGIEQAYAYDLSPDMLYENSLPVNRETEKIGNLIRDARIVAGLTQDELALNSGTTRHYISRIENDKSDIELSTLRKIVEVGLGRKLKLEIV